MIANIISRPFRRKRPTRPLPRQVDALNNALNAVIAGHAPTAADGIAWANLQDVVLGMKAEAKLLVDNPQLVPQ